MTDPDALMPLPDPPAEGLPVVPCSECKRPLTGHVARRLGMGEGCRRKLGLRTGRRPPEQDCEQDGLPGM